MKKKMLLLTLIVMLALAMCACSSSKNESNSDSTSDVDIEEETGIAGEYVDEVSQRAQLSIYDNEDGTYEIEISWGSSASQTTYWLAQGSFDGTVLSYEGGEEHEYTYDEDGEVKEDVLQASDLSGTLTLGDDGKLTWAGAAEDESGVFVKVSFEEDE